MNNNNIAANIQTVGRRVSEKTAIVSSDGITLKYKDVLMQIEDISDFFSGLGISRGDRVALALKDGPETVLLFLGISAIAACSPLNPAYTIQEYRFYLEDVCAKVVIVHEGDGAAAAAAADLGITIVYLAPRMKSINLVKRLTLMNSESVGMPKSHAHANDVALILHTSGTTSCPKSVPITHSMILASASNTAKAFCLTDKDRCLNTAPLFHTHGLIVATAVTLTTGGTVMLYSLDHGMDKFAQLLTDWQPTWYTAAPAVQQAILNYYREHPGIRRPDSLRFIRSAAAPLAKKITEDIESIFGVPVIDTYGMTEAASQITSQPLPPAPRKSGSVGISNGCRLRIVDEQWNLLPPNYTGEITICGENVLLGYENNSEANCNLFKNRWFKTGDEGYLDEEGYLYITGRIKEIINRGGQKVSPAEIDACMLEIPGVAEAAAFPIKHSMLGEDIAAALVLRPGAILSEADVRRFLVERFARYKVPRHFLFVDSLPKGPTGKVQRTMLADQLNFHGSVSNEATVAPRNDTEIKLVNIWEKVLNLKNIGVTDDFFYLGGDSLAAVQLLAEIEEHWGLLFPVYDLFRGCTIETMAAALQEYKSAQTNSLLAAGHGNLKSLVPIQPCGNHQPLICIHTLDGDVVSYISLVENLGQDYPVYGLKLDLQEADGASLCVEALAEKYVEDIKKAWPEGPYYLIGYSFGGVVAFEMAQQLQKAGQSTPVVVMLDTRHPCFVKTRVPYQKNSIKRFVYRLQNSMQRTADVRTHLKEYFYFKIKRELNRLKKQVSDLVSNDLTKEAERRQQKKITKKMKGILQQYRPKPYTGKVILFRAAKQPAELENEPSLGWSSVAAGGLEIYNVSGNHSSILFYPSLGIQLKQCLEAENNSKT